jgi:hypothetical protein
MRKARLLGAVATVLLAGLALSSAAAQAGASIQVVPSTVGQGQRVTVYGSGFCDSPDCSSVTIMLNTQTLAPDVQVMPDGTFQYLFIVTQTPDQYRVTARQTTSDGSSREASYGLMVLGSDLPPGETPPVESLPPTVTDQATPAMSASPESGSPIETSQASSEGSSSQDNGGASALPWILAAASAVALVALLLIGRNRFRRGRPR